MNKKLSEHKSVKQGERKDLAEIIHADLQIISKLQANIRIFGTTSIRVFLKCIWL